MSFQNFRITPHDCTNVDTDRTPHISIIYPCQHQLQNANPNPSRTKNPYDFRIAPRMHRLIQLMMEWTNHLEHKEYVSSLVYLRFNPPIASIEVLGESKIMWGANRSRHDRESPTALLSQRPLDLPGLVLISIQILIHNGLFWKGKVSILSLSIVLYSLLLFLFLLLYFANLF